MDSVYLCMRMMHQASFFLIRILRIRFCLTRSLRGKLYFTFVRFTLFSRQAPSHVFQLRHGQELDLRIVKRVTETYKKPILVSSNQGHRLGSVSSITTTSSDTLENTHSFTTNSEEELALDQNVPQTQLQIRLANGQR
jgi:hypothetical protein